MIVGAVLAAEIVLLCVVTFTGKAQTANGVIVKPGAASIEFANQTSPWGQILVKKVVSPAAAWLVVQSSPTRGGAAVVYGRRRVGAGQSTDIRITLDRNKKMPNTLVLTLVADRGQPGVFEYVPSGEAAGGGGMGGGAAPTGSSGSTPTPATDKQMIADGKPVVVTVHEVYHDARGDMVVRTAQPASVQ
jgi:hypothetical protein